MKLYTQERKKGHIILNQKFKSSWVIKTLYEFLGECCL